MLVGNNNNQLSRPLIDEDETISKCESYFGCFLIVASLIALVAGSIMWGVCANYGCTTAIENVGITMSVCGAG